MEIFDQKQTLESFRILVDSREQNTPRARKRYAAFGVPWQGTSLNYGDYAFNATLPGGTDLFDTSGTVFPPVAIERKMSLDELAACFTSGRRRFQKEFERAAANNARVFLLCENATWENLLSGKYRSRFHPAAFAASIIAWTIRYNLQVIFCKEETSSRLIKEILYRDLKERLERGEYG